LRERTQTSNSRPCRMASKNDESSNLAEISWKTASWTYRNVNAEI